VPGDGRFEWAGFLDPDEMPCVIDPAHGLFATANEMNLPADWDHDEKPDRVRVGRPGARDPYRRSARDGAPHGVADSCALQTDAGSVPARRLARVLETIAEPGEARPRCALRGWDGDLRRQRSGGAGRSLVDEASEAGRFRALVADAAVARPLPPGDTDTLLA
jgi:penicillin amidase